MINILTDYDIRSRNTFGMQCTCARWIEYTSPADLPVIFADETVRSSFKAIGEGSNLLFATGYYGGTLLHSRIMDLDMMTGVDGAVSLHVGSGMNFDSLVRKCVESGLWGIENLSGIPGQVGAAAVQNIGAYGVEVCDVITSVEAWDTVSSRYVTFPNSECRYAYRSSRFKCGDEAGRYVVTAVNMQLSTRPRPCLSYGHLRSTLADPDNPTLGDIREAVIAMRDSKLPDPAVAGNAGSFFMNPIVSQEVYDHVLTVTQASEGADATVPHFALPDGRVKIPAAWLIDHTGWKGRSIGGASVWEKQPLVIVNRDRNATAEDVIALREAIINSVSERYGITLHPEVEEVK